MPAAATAPIAKRSAAEFLERLLLLAELLRLRPDLASLLRGGLHAGDVRTDLCDEADLRCPVSDEDHLQGLRCAAMAEFKYVTLPTDGKQVRSGQVDEYASAQLNASTCRRAGSRSR
jgi:hypothetical protein